jgi:hypothetical protein
MPAVIVKKEVTTPVITAPMPKHTLPGLISLVAAIAYVMIQKYLFRVNTIQARNVLEAD